MCAQNLLILLEWKRPQLVHASARTHAAYWNLLHVVESEGFFLSEKSSIYLDVDVFPIYHKLASLLRKMSKGHSEHFSG